ncbi:uncharacterized protein LOC143239535 isoform X3 [Tachypleus tridentatus]|uniref:uncharacterized protein LOC143239535 isoform X3 n=1 Tax=Tachypleus tridentatus TaxID=6853 RepID=UPI003FD14F5D
MNVEKLEAVKVLRVTKEEATKIHLQLHESHQTADKQPFLLVSHRGLSTYHKHPTEVATSLPSGSTLLVDNTMSAPLLLRDILACKKGKHMEKRYPIRPGLRPLINNLTRHEDSVHSDF